MQKQKGKSRWNCKTSTKYWLARKSLKASVVIQQINNQEKPFVSIFSIIFHWTVVILNTSFCFFSVLIVKTEGKHSTQSAFLRMWVAPMYDFGSTLISDLMSNRSKEYNSFGKTQLNVPLTGATFTFAAEHPHIPYSSTYKSYSILCCLCCSEVLFVWMSNVINFCSSSFRVTFCSWLYNLSEMLYP